MLSKNLAMASVCLLVSAPLAGQPSRLSAWETMVSQNPVVVDDESVSWKERLILNALTPEQAELYFSGRAGAESLTLEDGRTLAEYLDAKLSPPVQVFVPLPAPCPLFSVTLDGSSLHRLELQARSKRLAAQGGSAEGCGIPAEASAVLLHATVRSLEGIPARLKLWPTNAPEPAWGAESGSELDWPLAYETTLLAALCGGGCPAGEFQVRTGESALVSAGVLGYFRPLTARDAPGGGISLSTEGASNNFFGTGAGIANTTGLGNSFFGGAAGHSNTEGSVNSFFGTFAGTSNTTGSNNSFFGEAAGKSNTTGLYNSFFGDNAGYNNTTGSDNSFFGDGAGFYNTEGIYNSFFGSFAGISNTTGSRNSFLGDEAGRFNSTGSDNSFFGVNAGQNNTEGEFNCSFGKSAGLSNTTEDNNTFIGATSNGVAGITNATALGFKTQVSQSNSLVLGSVNGLNGASSDVKVGIGTDAPQAALHVRRADGTARVLVEEANAGAADRRLIDIRNNGPASFTIRNTAIGNNWNFTAGNFNFFQISQIGSGVVEFALKKGGDATFAGDVTANGILLTSDREMKENIEPVDSQEILRRVAELPISRWNLKNRPSEPHIGPMAQDFKAILEVGDDERRISPIDTAGAALAAVQGLYQLVRRENEALREQIRLLRERVAALENPPGGD